MKNVKTRSVGAASTPARARPAKALTTLMLCAAVLALGACGQKRPLQLPVKHPAPASAPATSAAPAASAASAAR
jgi:predicted small lipoprotein YifL